MSEPIGLAAAKALLETTKTWWDDFSARLTELETQSQTLNLDGRVSAIEAKEPVWDGLVSRVTALEQGTPQQDTTAPIVTISPTAGTYTNAQSVTLSANETATIYYTLDGSTPTTSSSVYNGTFTLNSSATVKYFAKDTAGNSSAVQSTVYTINLTVPDTTPPAVTISPASGTYTSVQSVSLSSNEAATIYYTLDGSTPTTSSAVYSSPISINSTKTIKYFAKDTAGNSSTVLSATYTISIPNTGLPAVNKIVVVIMENHAQNELEGSSSAPYFNSLIAQGANFKNMTATDHPSQPNYIEMFSGSNQGCTDDNYITAYSINQPNLYTVLNSAGKTFGSYSEDMPSVGYTGDTYNNYASKHNPASKFSNVPTSVNMPFTNFPTNFANLPDVSYVIPNLINDIHDGTISQGDTWLQTNIDSYVQWAKSNNSLLIVTFDEDDYTQNNIIPFVMVGQMVQHTTVNTAYDHYSLLRTLIDLKGGTSYPGASATAKTIVDGWGTTTSDTTPPNNVTNLAVSNNNTGTSLTLTWTASTSSDIASYDIYNGATLLGNVTATTYGVTGLTRGTSYTFYVKAKDTSGNISTGVSITVTATDTTVPNNVTNLATSNVSDTSLTLNWTASTSTDVASYDVYNGATLLGNTTTTSYNVSGLTGSTSYTFNVKAKDAAGNVASGSSVTVTTSAPLVIVASDSFNRANGSMGSIDNAYGGSTALAWTAIPNAPATAAISNNAATFTSVNYLAGMYVDTGYSDGKISVVYSTVGYSQRLIFRASGSAGDFFAVSARDTNGVRVYKFVNGTQNILDDQPIIIKSGDEISVQLSGSTIKWFVNGVQQGNTITDTYNQTATKHGIGISGDSPTTIFFDDFKVKVAAPPVTNISMTTWVGGLQ